MELKPYGILAPQYGIKQDFPSILLSEAYASEGEDIIFTHDKELHRAKKRLLEFSQVLPDNVLKQHTYKKPSTDKNYLMLMTKRDICIRDSTNDRFTYLTPTNTTGTITILVGTPTIVTGLGTLWNTVGTQKLKVGDFIKIGAGSIHTGSTWYEVLTVESDTQVTLTAAAAACAGSNYVARRTFAGAVTDLWSCCTFKSLVSGEVWVATNGGVDSIVQWQASGQVSDLSCAYKAMRVFSYENYLLLGATIEASTLYPERIRRSAVGDETTWTAGHFMTATEGEGKFEAFSQDAGFLTIWKTNSIIKAWLVDTSDVFNKALVVDGVGTPAPDSLVTTTYGTFFFGNDNTIRLYRISTWDEVSGPMKPTLDLVNPTYSYLVKGTWIKEYKQVAFAFPYSDSTTNDKVIIYGLDSEKWSYSEVPVCSWGQYTLESAYTWDTLPFETWNDWAWDRWNIRTALSGNPIDLCAGYDGYIYRVYGAELDNDVAYTGFAVLETTLSQEKSLSKYKRVLKITAVVRQEASGTLSLDMKRDDEEVWQDAGTFSLVGDTPFLKVDLPVDYRAKNFKIKTGAENRWRLIGLIFWFYEDGEE